ncbi:MFS transporter [Nitrospira sp. Nam80]
MTSRRFMIFFGVAACAQGLTGLLNHPLTYYLKSLGLGADEVNQALAMAALPWIVKPLYGLLTDFVPLFGYRRKSYLLVTFAGAAMGYAWLTQLFSAELIIGILCLTTISVAATDVVLDALMVEQGQRTGLIRAFQGQQWTWLNVSAVGSALLGGWLTHSLEPATALHAAALIIVAAPLTVSLATIWLLPEERTVRHMDHVHATRKALGMVLTSRAFWVVAGFLVVWNLTPRFTTPLYYHMTDRLMFDQYFLGQLNAVGAIGAAVGAIGYKNWLAGRFHGPGLLSLNIILTGMVSLAHLLLVDTFSAVFLYFVGGVISMISLLTLFSLAAMVCPPRVAAFSFAALMALYSAGGQVGSILGGHLYEAVFHHEVGPLIWLASGITLALLVWVPWLPYGNDRIPVPAETDAQGRPLQAPAAWDGAGFPPPASLGRC